MALHLHRDATHHANGFLQHDASWIVTWPSSTHGMRTLLESQKFLLWNHTQALVLPSCVNVCLAQRHHHLERRLLSCVLSIPPTVYRYPHILLARFRQSIFDNILFCRADWVNEPIPELKDEEGNDVIVA